MDYLDFEIEIGTGSGRMYPVAILRSAAGEARETMRFPFDELALENHLKDLEIALLRSGGKRRQILSPQEQTVQKFGRALFEALFTGQVLSRYAVSQREAAQQGKGLRLKLRIQSPELAALPWEFMFDRSQGEYICLSSNTPIVRYIELPQPSQPLTVTPPLSILGMTVGPKDLADLDIQREQQRVEKAIEGLRTHNLVNLTWLAGQTWQDLQRAMRRGPWHIFHFIGHGGFDDHTDEGLIALADETGKSVYLSATNLGRLLADHRSLRLVVLNSCEGARGSSHDIFSSTASILVRRGIPAVLAMQYAITDRAAIDFSRAFYEALADGTPVDTAVGEARKAISIGIGNTVEWGTPVLFMRSSDGVLFELKEKTAIQQAQPDQSAHVNKSLEQPSIVPSVPKPQPLPLSPPSEKIAKPGVITPAVQRGDTVSPFQSPLAIEKLALLRTLTGHTGGVSSVAISADGQTLASGSEDKTIKVWNLSTGKEMGTLTGHTAFVRSVAISADGQTLASGSWDQTIKVWNLSTGKEVRTLTSHTAFVRSVAISADGQTLVSGSNDKTIKVWRA